MAEKEKNEEVIEIPVGKYLSLIRKNTWLVVSIVLFIALIAVFFWKASAPSTTENIISEKDAAANLLSFINAQGTGTAEVVSSASVGPFYEVQLKFQGQQFPAHITKDGNFLVLNSIPISSNAPKLAQAEPPKQQSNEPIQVDIKDSPSKGNKSAKVVIVEFTDYQCPVCKNYVDDSYAKLTKEYVDTGKVFYVVKDFPIYSKHPEAQKAAEAARCVQEQKGDAGYFKMHDLLFKNQDSLNITNYKKWALQLGIITSKFDSCMNESKYASAVQQDASYGQQIGVTGTPSFFINGKLMAGAPAYDTFKQLIDQELKA